MCEHHGTETQSKHSHERRPLGEDVMSVSICLLSTFMQAKGQKHKMKLLFLLLPFCEKLDSFSSTQKLSGH